jgi:hypothetical protein
VYYRYRNFRKIQEKRYENRKEDKKAGKEKKADSRGMYCDSAYTAYFRLGRNFIVEEYKDIPAEIRFRQRCSDGTGNDAGK